MISCYRVDLEENGTPWGREYFLSKAAATAFYNVVNERADLLHVIAQPPVPTEVSDEETWRIK